MLKTFFRWLTRAEQREARAARQAELAQLIRDAELAEKDRQYARERARRESLAWARPLTRASAAKMTPRPEARRAPVEEGMGILNPLNPLNPISPIWHPTESHSTPASAPCEPSSSSWGSSSESSSSYDSGSSSSSDSGSSSCGSD
jgi:hypothetical protein